MQEEINKNKNITANSEQLSTLKTHFPQCFNKDGSFRPDKLEDIVRASGADITREGYKLDWLGKSYARLLANLKTETLLAPNAEHNAKPENVGSENLLIQGDNLDVLKHLVNAYSEKVKMIYIDPPYNTGSDGFVYNDTRKFTVEELQRLAGVEEDEAKRILDFMQSSSNSHSAWLTFMYPRLYVARELLREDGVIFISIDDNEQAQLKLLCDEVFGAENFVAEFVWNTDGHTDNQYDVKVNHEYVCLYSKTSTSTLENIVDPNTRTESNLWKGYAENSITKNGAANPASEVTLPVGFPTKAKRLELEPTTVSQDFLQRVEGLGYITRSLTKEFGISYPIRIDRMLADEGTLTHECRVFSGWANVNKLKKFIASGCRPVSDSDGSEIAFFLSENGVIYYRKTRSSAQNILSVLRNFSTTEKMRAELEATGLYFSYPKPKELVSYLVSLASVAEDIVLDFFSGSGTTAHAVMALNAQDGGNRRHISVQLDEPTDEKSEARKAGHNNIFEITRERIKRAAVKIKEDHPDATCDFGFKEFTTIPANEGQFQGYLDDAATSEDYVPFNGMALDDDGITALLTTWQAYDGLPLHQTLQEVDLGGYTAYMGGDKLYFVNRGLSIEHIAAMLTRIDDDATFTPRKIVVFHYRFDDKQLREFSEAVNAPNRKHLQLDFIQRF